MKKRRCTRIPACELWDEEMLLEVRERERERQHAPQPQGLPLAAPPVRPLQPVPLVDAAIAVLENFEWIDNASMHVLLFCVIVSYLGVSGCTIDIVGNHPFTTAMVRRLTCGYCHVRLNSVADLRYHLTHVRRHSVYACCGTLFKNEADYRQHERVVSARHFHRVARP